MRQVLVTGGAGYIGSHAVHALTDQGDMPIIFDNLSTGFPQHLPAEAKLVVGDLGNDEDLDHLFKNYHFDAVMHLQAVLSSPNPLQIPGFTIKTIRLIPCGFLKRWLKAKPTS